jgi:hypothetical protein
MHARSLGIAWTALFMMPHLALAAPSFTGRPGDTTPDKPGSHA